MAWHEKEMQPWRPRREDLLHRPWMLAVLHYQSIVQYQLLQSGDRLGEVRAWDLHVFHFIKVRLCSIE